MGIGSSDCLQVIFQDKSNIPVHMSFMYWRTDTKNWDCWVKKKIVNDTSIFLNLVCESFRRK